MGRIAGITPNTSRRALSGGKPDLSETERILSAEVEDLKGIHALSLRLAEAETLTDVLVDVLRTAADLVDAQLGSAQLLTADGNLGLVGHIGFSDDILDRFAVVSLKDCTSCAVALRRRARVAIGDVRTDADFTDIAVALNSYGAVGAVSTPILDKGGNVLAMFSVYWLEEHEPDERDLRVLDLCAELAGRHVERSVAAEQLRDREQRQHLLLRELAHRGKNLLSVMQAIASRSLRGERTLDEAREVFIGRLGAMAKTYNALTQEGGETVDFLTIVSDTLKSHIEQVVIRGPAIVMPARNAQMLALVVHELATNAAKYGALSVASGRIEVTWTVTEIAAGKQQFSLQWTEAGGPLIDGPTRKGFGTSILTAVVGTEFKSVPAMIYDRAGFQYRLECALSALTESKY